MFDWDAILNLTKDCFLGLLGWRRSGVALLTGGATRSAILARHDGVAAKMVTDCKVDVVADNKRLPPPFN